MIRQMTTEDIGPVIGLCNLMYQESPNYKKLVFSPSRVKQIALNAIKEGFAEVAVNNLGHIVGVMAGCLVQPSFSQDFMACDYILYVIRAFRGPASFRLVNDYIKWAKMRGASLITVGVTSGGDNAKAIEFYEAIGFQQSGVQLRMEV